MLEDAAAVVEEEETVEEASFLDAEELVTAMVAADLCVELKYEEESVSTLMAGVGGGGRSLMVVSIYLRSSEGQEIPHEQIGWGKKKYIRNGNSLLI